MIRIGAARELAERRGRVEIYFEPRDIWIGAYVSRLAVYILPVPFVVFRISRGRRWV